MELREVILRRRTYTKYLEKKVNPKLVTDILNVAIHAPSSGNMQNWNIVLVDDDDKKKQIAQACLEQMWMLQAPMYIVILNKKPDMKRMFGVKANMFGVQNCAALAQNILLLATEEGLASCWVGSFDKDAVSRVVNAPPTQEPQIIITLGYSNDNPRSTRVPLDKVCCFNECGDRMKGYGLFPLQKHMGPIKKESKGLLNKVKNMFKKDNK
ncbi:MAG: nitroreductase family protein [Candidatus Nanoarchaeia archaeon]|jgi:nitroreductase|nr:nitroreductase family protein [Candidatus Nanoarchaeia archaeon]|tara:strand:- start:24714 stop:25346 length:633 start_codon:yes stop_codon:yes gene_type:complete